MFNFIRKIFKKDNPGMGVGQSCDEGDGIILDEETDGIVETISVEHTDNTPVEEKPVKQMPSTKGLICINNGEKNRYIHPEDPIPEGWVLGGKKKNR